ncbi:MAG: hypothetical protein U0525_01175 [Patescibacteria group bacterium]
MDIEGKATEQTFKGVMGDLEAKRTSDVNRSGEIAGIIEQIKGIDSKSEFGRFNRALEIVKVAEIVLNSLSPEAFNKLVRKDFNPSNGEQPDGKE